MEEGMILGVFSAVATFLTSVVVENPKLSTFVTIGSAFGLWWNNHKNRVAVVFGHSIQAIAHLDQRWESVEMRNYRIDAATALIEERGRLKAGQQSGKDAKADAAFAAVAGFLEMVGCFVRMKAIDSKIAWQLFGNVVFVYSESSRHRLNPMRLECATAYSEMNFLYLKSRVEEDSFGWFPRIFATRYHAIALVIKSTAPNEWRYFYILYAYLLALFFGSLAERLVLVDFYTEKTLFDQLTRELKVSPGIELVVPEVGSSRLNNPDSVGA